VVELSAEAVFVNDVVTRMHLTGFKAVVRGGEEHCHVGTPKEPLDLAVGI
jgi:hypothetical protein